MGPSIWDKAAVIMSGLALIISIVMPIIGYYWLDPKLQELRHAPKLEVIKVYNNSMKIRMNDEPLITQKTIGVMMTNKGLLPATDIKVIFHVDRPVNGLDINVLTEPPCPFKVDKSGNSVIVALDRVIGNGQTAGVKLSGIMNDIETWVYSNQGAERLSGAISSLHPEKMD